MNKLSFTLSLVLSLVLVSCSSDEPDNSLIIDGELATLYVGSYMEETPGYGISVEYFTTEQHTLLHDAVPYVKTNQVITESTEKMNQFSITMNLLFTSKAAQFEVDSICQKYVVSIEYNKAEYKYSEGTYTIASQEHPGYMISYKVSATEIVAAYVEKQTGVFTSSYNRLYELKNFKRIAKENLKATKSDPVPKKSRYVGKLTVKAGEIPTLENEDFTFEFNPATGALHELKPENKSLGDLERASERLVATE